MNLSRLVPMLCVGMFVIGMRHTRADEISAEPGSGLCAFLYALAQQNTRSRMPIAGRSRMNAAASGAGAREDGEAGRKMLRRVSQVVFAREDGDSRGPGRFRKGSEMRGRGNAAGGSSTESAGCGSADGGKFNGGILAAGAGRRLATYRPVGRQFPSPAPVI